MIDQPVARLYDVGMDSGAALQDFLEYILTHLVEFPEQASVSHEILEDGKHLYRVRLAEDDVGRVIGRNGFTVSAIRSLMAAAAQRNGVKVGLKVFQHGEEEGAEERVA